MRFPTAPSSKSQASSRPPGVDQLQWRSDASQAGARPAASQKAAPAAVEQTPRGRWPGLRPWVRRMGRAIFVVVYTAIFLECFIRVFTPALIMPRYVIDAPYGIRVNEPSRSFWHQTPEYRIEIRTNSKGVRCDREIPYEKPEGTFRIVSLGDSYTVGYGVSVEDLWLTQMENELRASGINCEVVNLGVSGHSTSEELIHLKEEGLKYHPDLVLVGWNHLDLSRNVRADLFRLGKDGLVRGSPSYLPAVSISRFLFTFGAYRFLAENSHLYCKVRETASDIVIDLMDTLHRLRTRVARWSRAFSAAAAASRSASRSDGDYEEKLAIALLAEMAKISRQNGASLVVLDIPVVVRDGDRRTMASRFPRCDGFRVDIYCPAAELSRHPVEATHWTKSCGHWTPLGCSIVGRGLAKHILSDSHVRIEQATTGESRATGRSGL